MIILKSWDVSTYKGYKMSAYSNGNYGEATPLFEKVGTQEEDPSALFYLGNAYLATGRHQDAILAFEKTLTYPTALAPRRGGIWA
jgi:tetratricopeptide (TPR) repeat protein